VEVDGERLMSTDVLSGSTAHENRQRFTGAGPAQLVKGPAKHGTEYGKNPQRHSSAHVAVVGTGVNSEPVGPASFFLSAQRLRRFATTDPAKGAEARLRRPRSISFWPALSVLGLRPTLRRPAGNSTGDLTGTVAKASYSREWSRAGRNQRSVSARIDAARPSDTPDSHKLLGI